jgi:KipI family sensor histidine kinase inhibitor
MSKDFPKITVAGENSLIVYFSERPCEKTSSLITHTASQLHKKLNHNLIDLVPSYHSLLVTYNAIEVEHSVLENHIKNAIASWSPDIKTQIGRHIELPVYYSLESGPDLQRLAEHAKLTVDEAISIHQQSEYTVYAMGFAPGFAYLGEIDRRIAIPRLATPRTNVPKGAVAIADRQTAIYPAQSPGGWNLIGLCPTVMFDPNQQPSTLVEVGDRVSFKAIDRHEFIQLGGSEQLLVGDKQ